MTEDDFWYVKCMRWGRKRGWETWPDGTCKEDCGAAECYGFDSRGYAKARAVGDTTRATRRTFTLTESTRVP